MFFLDYAGAFIVKIKNHVRIGLFLSNICVKSLKTSYFSKKCKKLMLFYLDFIEESV